MWDLLHEDLSKKWESMASVICLLLWFLKTRNHWRDYILRELDHVGAEQSIKQYKNEKWEMSV